MSVRAALGSLAWGALLVLAVAAPFAALGLLGVRLIDPAGLLLALLALPLLLLFMLRPRHRRRPVASVLFWRAVAAGQQAGTPFQRLRRNLPLLLLLLALGALAYGRARPVARGEAQVGRSVVLLLDTSASMLAREGERTRFDLARAGARAELDALGPGDEACLVAVDAGARTIVPWTSDVAALLRGLEALEPRHLRTELAEGLLLAAGAGRGAQEVHLFSDFGGPPPPPVGLGGPLRAHRIGGAQENLAVFGARARVRLGGGAAALAPGDGLVHEVFATVHNAGARRRSAFVALERDGRTLAARRVEVEPGAAVAVVLEVRLAAGPLAVRLLPAQPGARLDAQPLDDVAWLVIPERPGVDVALASASAQRGSPIERALVAAGARVHRLEPDAPPPPEARLVVYEGLSPASLPPRDCLLIDPPAAVGPVAPGAAVEAPRVAGWDRDHPLLRYVDLSDVALLQARPLTVGSGARVLLQGEDPRSEAPLVLMASWEEGEARRTAIAFDLDGSSWPLRASFPIFVKNCVDLAARRGQADGAGTATGEPLAIPTPPGLARVTVIDPRGARHEVAVDRGHAGFAATDWAGIYRVEADGAPLTAFAVNLADPDEARIAPRDPPGDAQEASPASATRTRSIELTPWLAALALLVLTAEAWVSHRRL